MNRTEREQLAVEVEQAGQTVNQLRQRLLESNCVYLAGLTRGAEESLLVAHSAINDTNVPEDQL